MLEIVPMTLKEGNAFVEQNHRHHGKVTGHKFSIGLSDGEKIVGVAIVGRPVARYLDDGWTLEVNRLCTDGTRNACSMLYAAAWRAARAMGYKRIKQSPIALDDHPTSLDITSSAQGIREAMTDDNRTAPPRLCSDDIIMQIGRKVRVYTDYAANSRNSYFPATSNCATCNRDVPK